MSESIEMPERPAPKSFSPLWLIVIAAVIGACVWYIMRSESIPLPEVFRQATEKTSPTNTVSAEIVLPISNSGEQDISKAPAAPAAPNKEDAVVRPLFIDDLAGWIVHGYVPSPNGKGKIVIGIQEANMRYGVHMRGLRYKGKDATAGRSDILRYICNPAVIKGLYGIYADRFMERIVINADKASYNGIVLTPLQKVDMYRQYSREFLGLSGILKGIAALPVSEITRYSERLTECGNRVVAAENHYGELVFAQDRAMEKGQKDIAVSLKMQIQNAADAYRAAVIAREKASREFAAAIKKNTAAKSVADDNAIFIAQWAERRIGADKSNHAIFAALADITKDVSDRFGAAAHR